MHKLEIHDLRTHLELTNLRCAALIREFSSATTPEQKNLLAARWERAVHEGQALRHQLELLEEEHRRQFGDFCAETEC
ncbi:MAG: hypothetical protein ABSD70_17225 [Terracidiphilus sp.]|jgi:hypothetical protein